MSSPFTKNASTLTFEERFSTLRIRSLTTLRKRMRYHLLQAAATG
jgi:hypothetical protein